MGHEDLPAAGHEKIKPEVLLRTSGEIMENLLWNSNEFIDLNNKLKEKISFEEVNALLDSFNKSKASKDIGAIIKNPRTAQTTEAEIMATQTMGVPIYIEKTDGKSITKIMAYVDPTNGMIAIGNGMNKDGTINKDVFDNPLKKYY